MRAYCMKFYLPICHGSGQDRGTAHRHTMEVTIYFPRQQGKLERFSDMEKDVAVALRPYTEGYLNDHEEFREDASVERMGEAFFDRLSGLLEQRGSTLLRLEIGETPLRKYAVGIEECEEGCEQE